MKTCTQCGATKARSEFYANRSSRDGLYAHCKECRKKRLREWTEEKKKDPTWLPRRYAQIQAHQRRTQLAEYNDKFKAQKGRCAICKRKQRKGEIRFARDHCHVTGKVRDLLCASCNYGLGCFRDDPVRLRAAADYIERHAEA